MNEAKIHNSSLINNYLPADYLDSFSKEVVVNKNITPDAFFDMAFNRFPAWIDWLLKLRNKIVKPLGLDTTSRFPILCVKGVLMKLYGECPTSI